MNSLSPGQELHLGDQLVSNNGFFVLEMYPSGGLQLYRKQTRGPMWASTALGEPGGWAVMQGDGNFVAYSAAGVPYWATNTDGNPGAWLALLDDGDLQILDGVHVLWQTNTSTNLDTPTIQYVGEGGYSYNETAEKWKQMCAAFPCFEALQWPGYATAIIEDVIDGEPVVIQLWKGLCEKFEVPLFSNLPGGVGGEVGIYRRIPGKVIPTDFSGLPLGGFLTKLLTDLGTLAAEDFWWPFPELGATIEMNFINPLTREIVFSGGPQTGYWLTKWMEPGSYRQYTHDHMAPSGYTDYVMEYTINGKKYHHWPEEPDDLGTAVTSAHAAWLLLLEDDPALALPRPPRTRSGR
jgi:hypothetical protein